MSDGDPPLRLLSLPNTPLQNIVRFMNHIDQFALSLVSKRSKELVKSIDIKCWRINIKVDTEVSIRIQFPRDTIECSFDDYQRSMETPSPTNIKSKVSLENRGGFEHSKPKYRFEEWLNHALEIYHKSELNAVHFITLLPDMESFRKTFGTFSYLKWIRGVTSVDVRDVFRTFRPENHLMFAVGILNQDRCEKIDSLHEVLVQNLDFIYIGYMGQLTLDDLLIMNCQRIEIFFQLAINYESILNLFIKHWMAGSNPRLRYIELECRKCRLPRAEAVLRGIKHQVVSKEDSKTLKAFRSFGIKKGSKYVEFLDGYNIRRRDGTVATISFNKRYYFIMLVWT
ncbi:hypothetical protein CRE_31454 [Caenorhabditis remanei]|uniref:F-box domain-containing protein n=1 Tax=Caenorhabditis remanei TaxID=31234 RepID=E3NAC6_CAERE|nr:hypothetical protein CRE_31454 [Caenorhabditis remanei]